MIEQDDNIDEEKVKLVLSIRWGIRGDMIDVDEATRLLDVTPSRMYCKGESYQARDGKTRIHPVTVWQLNSKGNVISDRLNDHAEFILKTLEPKIMAVQQLRKQADYCDISIWYEYHTEGCNNVASFGLGADLLARLAALASDVNFSIILQPLNIGDVNEIGTKE